MSWFDVVSETCLNLIAIAIITVKGVEYHFIIHNISKSDTTHLLESSVLDDHGFIKSIPKKSTLKLNSVTFNLKILSKKNN